MNNAWTIAVLLVFIISCQERQNKEVVTDRNTPNTNGDVQLPSGNCNIDTFLNNPEILADAKALWKSDKDRYQIQQVVKVLAALQTVKDEHLPFYMLVVGKALTGHDGELTELAMREVYEFVFDSHTTFFFDFFNQPHCLVAAYTANISIWAELSAHYLSMTCDSGEAFNEKEYAQCVERNIVALKDKCSACNMDNFINGMRSTL